MNGPKKLTADYSSIVGLKAELLRKRIEAQELKVKQTQNVPKHKPKVKDKSTKKKFEKVEVTPKVIEIEDANALKKSKLMLEAKSKLYNRLQKSKDNNDLFLVDFSNKADPESEKSDNEESYDSDDNFVEYKDCFGRTKKCLREDLPKMQEKDNLLRQQMSKEPVPTESVEEEKKPEPPQLEPELELMRKKWEEQTERLANKQNIFYQDVLFDEARTHGVGYYNFSLDEEERAKQHENLEKLRKETEQKQKEMEDLRQVRQKMEQNRLRVARIRQRIRAGLPAELPEEEAPEINVKNEKEDNPKFAEESEPTDAGKVKKESVEKVSEKKNSLVVIEDKVRAFGELLGKRGYWREMSQEEWVEKRRKDRLNEFAPKYDGFKSAGYVEFNPVSKSKEISTEKSVDDNSVSGQFSTPVHSVNEESDDSEIIGPMPYVDLTESIPLPPDPQLSKIPLPPTPRESTSNSSVCSSSLKVKKPINSDSIAAGLKYLRAKFEEKEKYEK